MEIICRRQMNSKREEESTIRFVLRHYSFMAFLVEVLLVILILPLPRALSLSVSLDILAFFSSHSFAKG
jgi:hypothetical protein